MPMYAKGTEWVQYVDTVRGPGWVEFFGQGQRLVGGSPSGVFRGGGQSPPDAGEFSKDFLINLLKMNVLACFSKKLTNHALIFRVFGRKTQIVGKFWENFEIFWWKFNRKIEFDYFWIFFTQNRGGHQGVSDFRTLQGVSTPLTAASRGCRQPP